MTEQDQTAMITIALMAAFAGGNRTLSAAVLKDAYAGLLGDARSMQGQYLAAIRDKARTINVAQILEEVRQ